MLLVLAGWNVPSCATRSPAARFGMGGADVANDLFMVGDPVMQDIEHWLFNRGKFKP